MNEIIQGDVLEVLKTMGSESVDCIITSPPYNLGIDYGIYKDNLSWEEYYSWCEKWINELFRVLKPDGRFCLNHYLSCGTSGNRSAPLMKLNEIASNSGFKHHALAVWADITLAKKTAWGSWLSASSPYINSPFEGILILYKDSWKKIKTGISDISKEDFIMGSSGVWKISPERNNDFPAPFPERLADLCIRLFTFKEDIVLDPFVGSGTTCLVAKRLGRNYLGIELNPEYVKIANNSLICMRDRDEMKILKEIDSGKQKTLGLFKV